MYSQIQPQFPDQEQLKCPRCDSPNTKFCYYNNYNLSQPRHFCKSCKRYWTKGGALRNIPVGGGSRKAAKRSSSPTAAAAAAKRPASESAGQDKKSGDKINIIAEIADDSPPKGENLGGQFGNLSFSSLLGSSPYVGFLDGLGPNDTNLQMNEHFGEMGSGRNVDLGLEMGDGGNGDGFLNMHVGNGGDGGVEDGGWSGGSNEWPDLAIYTPGSNF